MLPLASEHDVGGLGRPHELRAFISRCAHVQENQRNCEMQVVDEARTQVLLDGMSNRARWNVRVGKSH